MLTILNQWLYSSPAPSASVADHDGNYKNFTGKILYGDTLGSVLRASFSLEKGKIYWREGVWQEGVWEDGIWEDGEWVFGFWYYGVWLNGTWHGGYWYDGVWQDGVWEFGVRKNAGR